jgi:putative DNA primase/helicase
MTPPNPLSAEAREPQEFWQPAPTSVNPATLQGGPQSAPRPTAEIGTRRVRAPTQDWYDLLDTRHVPHVGNIPVSSVGNAVRILTNDIAWREVLAWDEFASMVVKRTPPPCDEADEPEGGTRQGDWTDDDTTRARLWLERQPEYRVRLRDKDVYTAVRVVAQRHNYHPVRAYLATLHGRWDGTPRLERWLSDYLGAPDTPYVRRVGAWWLVSAVARVCKPGCKVDTMLVLEGNQGAGKSTALRTLTGAAWFNDTPLEVGTKDSFLALRRCWIVEHAEMDALTKADASRVKAFLSSPCDRYRPPYGASLIEVPRQCVFAGTVNHNEYLKDPTGGRRFWPVRCGDIDLVALGAMRDQLWAEALSYYEQGARWYPTESDEVSWCQNEQEQRYAPDAWEDLLAAWLDKQPHGEPMTLARIMTGALQLDAGRQSRSEQTRVGLILERLGWEARRVRHGGVLLRSYERRVASASRA